MAEKGIIPSPFENFWESVPKISRVNLVETIDDLLTEKDHDNIKLRATELVDTLPEKHWRVDKPNLLEVVDPFLYCYVSAATFTTLKSLSKHCVFEKPCVKPHSANTDYSERFQLLPTEFAVDPKTKKVTTLSYINNLDPRKYKTLYESIELVVERSVPHFEKVLSELVNLNINTENTRITLGESPFQIIVGLKNIYLTPTTSPKYPGSFWHVEGLKNERIVASGIYYYDVANISESQLQFRVKAGNTRKRTEMGYSTAKSNRLVVFPNVFEHKVNPFELEDNSYSGYRKFITLFLVDPTTKIISTSEVAPQQESWYPITGTQASKLFPAEAVTTTTMTLEMAKKYRDNASAERGVRISAKKDEIPYPTMKRKRQEEEYWTPGRRATVHRD